MNRTHPVEFVLKPEENLHSCASYFQNVISYLVLNFSCVSQRLDINQSNEYEAISGIQNITPKGLLEESSFTFDSYKIFIKRFHFCIS